MKGWAVVDHGQPLEYVELPDLVAQGTEVVLAVSHCGVCHSDLHLWHGAYDLGGGRKLTVSERGLKLPAAPGHEIVGRVVRKGPDADGIDIGDERLIYPWIGCGRCPRCAEGQDNLCTAQRSLGVSTNGGFADEVIVPHPRYLFDFDPLPRSLAATYACSGLTAYSAIKKLAPIAPDEPVVVIGAGGLGLAAISLLRAMGHDAIVVVDRQADKLQGAMDAGARSVVLGTDDDVALRVQEACGGTARAAIDFVGATATASLGQAVVAKGGTLVLVGIGGGELTVSVAGTVFRALTISGSLTGSLSELRELVELARKGNLRSTPIDERSFSSVNDAMEELDQGKVFGRVVLVADWTRSRPAR